MMRSALALVLAALAALSCSCGKEKPAAVKAASSAAVPAPSAAAPEAPREPPTPSEEVSFETDDHVPLAATFYRSKVTDAPLLVLVHRFRGDRHEWDPFLARMATAPKRYSMLAVDLRGHGASRSGSGKKRLDWADMKDKDMPLLVEDVHAAMRYGFTQGGASRAVLVGSSLGAAFVARAASQEPKVVALALISPGAAIQGFDVYHPFADARTLPSFLAGAKEDNVSREPVDALSQMAKEQGLVKSYEGKGHGAFGLGAEGPLLWEDLDAWLDGIFEAQPVAREIQPRTKKKGEKR